MTIGERIQSRLDDMKMSQSELARRVGLSQAAVNGLIRGKARSSTHLHQIARELKTTSAFLTGETDDPEADFPAEVLTGEELDLVDAFRDLGVADRKLCIALIRRLSDASRWASPAADLMEERVLRGGDGERGTVHDRRRDYGAGAE